MDQHAERQPTAVLHVPGRFAEWFEGTGVAQGQDNADPDCRALYEAWKASHVVRTGRGYYHRVEATRTVLKMFTEYGGYCLDANEQDPVPAEAAAARTLVRRAGDALAALTPTA